ncbi:MAG TPA: preprotein translocase subunit SecG [Deltaproteobacteria bacterium]|jgi:preprotein translocase subunit SecG|nr:preprotein translocase subunit SecG [Deltaproteobacteria bacterium]HOI08314.1 preprotein translocase subunit SecG [Deltaproteobacteria bacterium]
MYGLVLTIHILVSILLIIAVLLQAGKGADMGAVFGGAGSQALFGSAGPADFLNKATRVLVVVFMLTSLTLGFSTLKKPSESVMQKATTSQPAAPAQSAPAPAAPQGAAPTAPAPSAPAAPAAPSSAPAAPAN